MSCRTDGRTDRATDRTTNLATRPISKPYLVRSVIPLLGLALSIGGGACGGGGGSAGSVPVSQFAAQYSQAMCGQNFKCCSASDIDGRTMQDCVSTNSALFDVLSASIMEGQSKNRLSYDATKMGMCMDALKALTCDVWQMGLSMSSQPAVCLAAITPKVAAGGACESDLECTTAHCEGADSSTTPPTDGACTTLPAAGGSCASVDCADGLHCDGTNNTCVANTPGGQACTSDDQCTNLVCNPNTHLCSGYAGCAVGGEAPPAGLLSLVLLGVAILLVKRARRTSVSAVSATTTSTGARRRPRRCVP